MLNSSTSNSRTLLDGAFKPGKAFCSWAVLFVLLNFLVGILGDRGCLVPGLPTKIVNDYVNLVSEQKDVWLIGNSVLDAAVQQEDLESRTGLKVAKMELGSMTMSAQVALAKHCLDEQGSPPSMVVFFVTKDDFNRNGSRTETSQNYHRVLGRPKLSDRLAPYLPLALYSASIRQEVRRSLGRLRIFLKNQIRKPTTVAPAPVADEGDHLGIKAAEQSGYLAELGQNFELDESGLEDVKSLAGRYPTVDFWIVFAPVTRGPEAWQAFHHPESSWPKTKARIVDVLAQSTVYSTDFSEEVPGTADFFKDFYHLNEAGGVRFTRTFSEWLVAQVSQRQ